MRRPRLTSDETRLLLWLAGGPEADDAIKELASEEINWARLLELSVLERTQPYVSRRLTELAAGRLPSDVLSRLKAVERIAEFRQRYLQRRLTDALKLLSAAEIPVVLLKGAALGLTTYGSFIDRPMGDLDLLVRPTQARAAFDVLTKAGWIRRLDADLDSLYSEMHHLPPLLDAEAPALGVGLELHTDIIPPTRNPFTFSAIDMWDSCQAVRGLPEGIYAPSPQNMLLHCCMHFVWAHTFQQSAWRTFHDVAALWSQGQIDWSALTEHARDSGLGTCCYWTLRLARSSALVPIPLSVLESLRPNLPPAFLSLLELHLRFQLVEAEETCPSLRLHRAIWVAAVRPRLWPQSRTRPWDYDGDRWARVLATKRQESPPPVQLPFRV